MSSPDQNGAAPDPGPAAPQVQGMASGCLTGFIVLWGIAFLLVGLLIVAVSGFCGFVVLESGDRSAVGELGGILMTGFIVGIVLCILGHFMLRGGGRDR
jgi:hypothetical protein